MFKSQPKIDIKPNESDRKIIFVGWFVVAVHFVLAISYYFNLPDIIPTHFNLKGEADGFGNKDTILILPILGFGMYLGMTLLATKMKPWNFNYPTSVTEKNAPKLYAMAIQLMVWLNFSIALMFSSITIEIILRAKMITSIGLGWMFVPMIAIVTLLPFVYGYKMFKISKA